MTKIFKSVNYITKEELSELTKSRVNSIENQKLLQDPLTNKYYLYPPFFRYRKKHCRYEDRIYETKWETFLIKFGRSYGSMV